MGSYLNPGTQDYQESLLLCGISYGKDKKHQCVIEKWTLNKG